MAYVQPQGDLGFTACGSLGGGEGGGSLVHWEVEARGTHMAYVWYNRQRRCRVYGVDWGGGGEGGAHDMGSAELVEEVEVREGGRLDIAYGQPAGRAQGLGRLVHR